MSLSELKRLKTTLADVETTRKKISEIPSEIVKLEKKLKSSMKRLQSAETELDKTKKLKNQHSEWLEDVEKKIQHNEKYQHKAETKVKNFATEEKPLIKKTEKEISDLREINHGYVMMLFAVFTLVLMTFYGTVEGWQEANNLPRGEWVCDNGEIIDLLDVMDGSEDCSDGSDEETNFFSDSRAEKAEDSEEYNELLDAKWGLWLKTIGNSCVPGVIFVCLAGAYMYFRNTPITQKVIILQEENKKRIAKEKSLKSNVKKWERKTSGLNKSVKTREDKISSIREKELHITEIKDEIKKLQKKITDSESNIMKLEQKEIELWESIRNLIPLGDTTLNPP